MQAFTFKNDTRFTEPRHAAALFAAMTLYQASAVLAAPPVIPPNIPPNPLQQGLPSIRHEEVVAQKEAPKPNRAEGESTLADQVLPSAIRQVVLVSPLFFAEIETLLGQFIGKDRVSGAALEQARGQIWELYRQRGRLARVQLRAIPGIEAAGGSTLQARIDEISVRSFRVEEEGGTTLKQSLLDDILTGAKGVAGEGGALDLDWLDSRLKRRMFVKDVNLRAMLIPIDPEQVDVNVLVQAAPEEPPTWLTQFDNDGMRTYGRDRYTATVSIPGRGPPGDQIDLMTLASSGMTFGRAGYEFPLVGLGARMNVSGSRIEYRVPSVSNGSATLLGAALSFPLHIDNVSVWTGTVNYLTRREAGHLSNGTPTVDKTTRSVQGTVDARFILSQAQSLYLNTTLTRGDLDLSALASGAAQDQSSAQTAGRFTKLESDAGWRAGFGASGKWDSRVAVKGQFASNNLDQSQKFALGGPLGVRAYSAAEALGDAGYVASTDLGYQPMDGLRIFTFYDIGRTRLYKQPWAVQATPARYTLQGAGIGASYVYKWLVGAASYARQVGANPGLSAAGLDADGSSRRTRLWLSLRWQA